MSLFHTHINIEEKLKGDEKVLLIDLRRIGDSLMSFPLLEALKDVYPSIRLDMIVEKASVSLLKGNPHIDDCYIFDEKGSFKSQIQLIRLLRSQNFDICIDTLGMPKSAILGCLTGAPKRLGLQSRRRLFYTHLIEEPSPNQYSAFNKQKILKLLSACPKPRLLPKIYIEETEKVEMRERLAPHRVFITSAPATRRENKQLWLPEQWGELYDQLINMKGLPIAITSAPFERPFIDKILSHMRQTDLIIHQTPVKNIRDLAILLSISKLHISGDNGSKHLANFVHTPCVTLWNYLTPHSNFSIPEDRQPAPDLVLWARDYMDGARAHHLDVSTVLEKINSVPL